MSSKHRDVMSHALRRESHIPCKVDKINIERVTVQDKQQHMLNRLSVFEMEKVIRGQLPLLTFTQLDESTSLIEGRATCELTEYGVISRFCQRCIVCLLNEFGKVAFDNGPISGLEGGRVSLERRDSYIH